MFCMQKYVRAVFMWKVSSLLSLYKLCKLGWRWLGIADVLLLTYVVVFLAGGGGEVVPTIVPILLVLIVMG